MNTGWILYNGNWYHLEDSGRMSTGWVLHNNNWYYMSSSGAMETGWIYTGGKWYYCYSNGNGNMAANTRIGGYRLGSNGAWIH